MANQSVGTPRFYIDYTQLSKVKGFLLDKSTVDTTSDNSSFLTNNQSSDNMRIWNFDYAHPKRYDYSAINHIDPIKYRMGETNKHIKLGWGFKSRYSLVFPYFRWVWL